MKRIEAVVSPAKLENIKEALSQNGIIGLTESPVMGYGHQMGRKEVFRGTEINVNLLPKVKIELVVEDEKLDGAIDIIIKEAHTGEIGDGKIFVYNIENVIRKDRRERRKSNLVFIN